MFKFRAATGILWNQLVMRQNHPATRFFYLWIIIDFEEWLMVLSAGFRQYVKNI